MVASDNHHHPRTQALARSITQFTTHRNACTGLLVLEERKPGSSEAKSSPQITSQEVAELVRSQEAGPQGLHLSPRVPSKN